MIKCLKKFEFDHVVNQARSVELKIDGKDYILFCVSQNKGLDPWPEAFGYIDYPLSMVMFDKEGNKIWTRTFGRGTIPGVWFTPFIAFDLDKDGKDEIYFVHNLDDECPFSQKNTYLDKIDPLTGETMELYFFPAENTVEDKMAYSYRHNLSAGYVHGEPVLVTEQGTYKDMFMQAYTTGMNLLWERVIKNEEKGCRASHHINIYDYNNDGVDEMYYGERMISMETGKDLACFDEDTFRGHSDIVLPFYDDNGRYLLYTCRENGNYIGCDRVVMYDIEGNSVWRQIKAVNDTAENHIHRGWIATVKPNFKKIAFASGLTEGTKHQVATEYVFDAMTGEEIDFKLPCDLSGTYPLDINGDGYQEFFAHGKGIIYDSEGNVLAELGEDASMMKGAKMLGFKGEQFMIRRAGQNVVEIWGDDEAVECERFKKRHARGFQEHMAKLAGAGYNHGVSISGAM